MIKNGVLIMLNVSLIYNIGDTKSNTNLKVEHFGATCCVI